MNANLWDSDFSPNRNLEGVNTLIAMMAQYRNKYGKGMGFSSRQLFFTGIAGVRPLWKHIFENRYLQPLHVFYFGSQGD